MVTPLRFCALSSGVEFCGNAVLVMGPYFRGGPIPIRAALRAVSTSQSEQKKSYSFIVAGRYCLTP